MTISTFLKRTATAGVMALAVAVPAKADWGGLYIGLSAGYVWGDTGDWSVTNLVTGTVPGTPLDNGNFGGHLGIQHQFAGSRIVAGLEVAYSGPGFGRKEDQVTCGAPTLPGLNANDACASFLNSLLTIGGRLGYAPSDQLLVYLSGGYAHANIQSRVIHTDNLSDHNRSAEHHDGWYVGGGLDWALTPNWIIGLEYQHVWLDSANHVGINCCNVDFDADLDIVRVRLSYKFGRPVAAPLK